MIKIRLTIILLILSALMIPACTTRMVLKQNPQPKTSFKEVSVPKDVTRYSLQSGEIAVKPFLENQVPPVYPPGLVQPRAAPVKVVAQLIVNKEGHVEDVIPVSNNEKGPQPVMFETAVIQAALKWRFTPLWFQKRNNDGSYIRFSEPFSLWYMFEFTIVSGKPAVEMIKQ